MIMFKYHTHKNKEFNRNSSFRKAQTSVEFLIIFVFLLTALATMSYISFQKSNDILENQKALEAEKTLRTISDKINIVFIEGYGFSMNVTLPQKVYAEDYTFELYENRLTINIFNASYRRLLATENITGLPQPGINVLENVNGVVVITQ